MLGAMLLGLIESCSVLMLRRPGTVGDIVGYVVFELALLAVWGFVAVVGCAMFARISAKARPLAAALLVTPLAIMVARLAFSGPRAQRLPGVLALQIAVVVSGVVLVLLVVRRMQRERNRERGGARASIFAAAAFGVAVVLCQVDLRVLVRLYPVLHRALEGAALCACIVGVARLRGMRTAQLWAALIVSLSGGGVLAGVDGLRPSVVAFALDRAPLASFLVRPLLKLKPARANAVDTSSTDEKPWPSGPVIGRRDVILVTVDALRADRLAAATMPTLSALAMSGVRFDHAITQVPHTSFALTTLLTGQHTYALSEGELASLSRQTLPLSLRQEGYATAAFYPPAVFTIDRDRLSAFETDSYGFQYVKYEYLDAQHRTDQVIEYFDSERPTEAFVWVHYFEPHEPYDVHPGFTAGTSGGPAATPGETESQARYDGEARVVDHELGRLLDYLRAHRRGALVIVCADHGEEFGEHGGRYHGTTLYDEQLRVPLVFALLGGDDLPARTIQDPVGLVDVAPTVLSLLGLANSSTSPTHGNDLSSYMGSQAITRAPRPVFAEIDRRKTVTDGNYKLTCDMEVGTCVLFDRATDKLEQHDVASGHADIVGRLRAQLDRFVAREVRASAALDIAPELAQALERGRMGDASAATIIASRLGTLDERRQLDALTILADLPPVPGLRPTLDYERSSAAPGIGPLLQLVLARNGDRTQRLALRKTEALASVEPQTLARIALETRDVPALIAALDRINDEKLVSKLADALAETHDKAALDPMIIALAEVRSRAHVARAIGKLGDLRAIDKLLRWLPNDPYVPVRVAMVQTLAQLAEKNRAAIDEALAALAATEQEPPVLHALVDALGPGRHGTITITKGAAPARADCERWLILAEAKGNEGVLRLDRGDAAAAVTATLSRPTSR